MKELESSDAKARLDGTALDIMLMVLNVQGRY